MSPLQRESEREREIHGLRKGQRDRERGGIERDREREKERDRERMKKGLRQQTNIRTDE